MRVMRIKLRQEYYLALWLSICSQSAAPHLPALPISLALEKSELNTKYFWQLKDQPLPHLNMPIMKICWLYTPCASNPMCQFVFACSTRYLRICPSVFYSQSKYRKHDAAFYDKALVLHYTFNLSQLKLSCLFHCWNWWNSTSVHPEPSSPEGWPTSGWKKSTEVDWCSVAIWSWVGSHRARKAPTRLADRWTGPYNSGVTASQCVLPPGVTACF